MSDFRMLKDAIFGGHHLHESDVTDVKFMPNKKTLASCGDDGYVVFHRAIDVPLSECQDELKDHVYSDFQHHKLGIRSIDIHPKHETILCATDAQSVLIFDR